MRPQDEVRPAVRVQVAELQIVAELFLVRRAGDQGPVRRGLGQVDRADGGGRRLLAEGAARRPPAAGQRDRERHGEEKAAGRAAQEHSAG
ncbi:MAG: hypothetical protein U0470_05785 [Anaerolineae bacterium]